MSLSLEELSILFQSKKKTEHPYNKKSRNRERQAEGATSAVSQVRDVSQEELQERAAAAAIRKNVTDDEAKLKTLLQVSRAHSLCRSLSRHMALGLSSRDTRSLKTQSLSLSLSLSIITK